MCRLDPELAEGTDLADPSGPFLSVANEPTPAARFLQVMIGTVPPPPPRLGTPKRCRENL